jgi:hypothetical protein
MPNERTPNTANHGALRSASDGALHAGWSEAARGAKGDARQKTMRSSKNLRAPPPFHSKDIPYATAAGEARGQLLSACEGALAKRCEQASRGAPHFKKIEPVIGCEKLSSASAAPPPQG